MHTAAIGLGALLKDVKGEEKKIQLIRTFINNVRFYSDNSGYFYVYKYNCVNIAHATQAELLGQNLYNYKDVKNKFVIRELSSMAKNGGGFVSYHWMKPNDDNQKDEKRKLGYVESIPGTDYFIGTGVYLPKL